MLADRIADAWNRRDAAAIGDLFAADGVRHEVALPGARLVGRVEITQHVQGYLDAVPDCRLEVRSSWSDRHLLVLEWTLHGTHLGDLPGLPARGEELALEGVCVCDVAGGLIREERVYWDAATLLAGARALDE